MRNILQQNKNPLIDMDTLQCGMMKPWAVRWKTKKLVGLFLQRIAADATRRRVTL